MKSALSEAEAMPANMATKEMRSDKVHARSFGLCAVGFLLISGIISVRHVPLRPFGLILLAWAVNRLISRGSFKGNVRNWFIIIALLDALHYLSYQLARIPLLHFLSNLKLDNVYADELIPWAAPLLSGFTHLVITAIMYVVFWKFWEMVSRFGEQTDEIVLERGALSAGASMIILFVYEVFSSSLYPMSRPVGILWAHYKTSLFAGEPLPAGVLRIAAPCIGAAFIFVAAGFTFSILLYSILCRFLLMATEVCGSTFERTALLLRKVLVLYVIIFCALTILWPLYLTSIRWSWGLRISALPVYVFVISLLLYARRICLREGGELGN
ncbi:hypothetical protein ACFL1X_02040 [Candidatus Hydrogenedentota bacterium]